MGRTDDADVGRRCMFRIHFSTSLEKKLHAGCVKIGLGFVNPAFEERNLSAGVTLPKNGASSKDVQRNFHEEKGANS